MKNENLSIKSALKGICFLITVLLFTQQSIAADAPGIPAGWSDGFVYANGIRIHYYRAKPAPDKPVIIMVHGVTDNGLCWTTITQQLEGDYDIFMLDARGHGLSDPFTGSDDGNTLVKDVEAFVKKMKLEKPIMIGHSMGAATVMRFGAEYPEIARAIIMLDPFIGSKMPAIPKADDEKKNEPKPDKSKKTKVEVPLPFNMMGSPETLVAQNNYSYDDLVKTCQMNTPKWALTDCQYWALSKKQYHGAYSDQAWQAMSGTMRTGESLAKISVPSLILKADAVPEQRKAQEEAASVMQDGKLVHIDGAGHNLHHDELDATLKVLRTFLSDL